MRIFGNLVVGFWSSLSVGFLATLLAGLIFQDLLPFMAATIICTLGIGLVFWIPVWWLVGFLLTVPLKLIVLKLQSDEEAARQQAAKAKKNKLIADAETQLVDYIRRKMASGGDKRDALIKQLKGVGWNDAEIANAFQRVAATGPKGQRSP